MAARVLPLVLTIGLLLPSPVVASDQVLDWIANTNDVVLASATNPLLTTRNVGLVGAALFDAVNGIEKRFDPLHVAKYTGPHASSRAAAVQAAYVMLLRLYPAQAATLNSRRDASLAAISSGPGAESDKEIAAGLAYGQSVAETIVSDRSLDGFAPDPPPPFVGVASTGFWRPTAAGATGAGAQFPTMTPWVLLRGSQFRLPAPPALGSAGYAADYTETRDQGRAGVAGDSLTANQTTARFWNGNTALYWNRIASQVSRERNLSLVENARLFGVLNVAMADAAIACWDTKYRFQLWRPVTAIQLAGPAGTPAGADPGWTPFLGATPSHPEYPSGHSTVSGAAAHVLGTFFGDNVAFTVTSETLPGTIRDFSAFSAALAQIHDARVFGGIHFRTACRLGSALGVQVAEWVMAHAMGERGDR